MEDDVVGLQREVVGQDMVLCELCGQAGAAVSVERLGGARDAAEPVEFMRVCRNCRSRLDRGEIQLDPELDADVDGTDE